MISLKKLYVEREGVPVLRNINIDISAGETVALFGSSGCGKSTLLKTLLGGCHWQGDYRFNNEPVTPKTVYELRKRAGYIGQENALGGDTVLDTLKQPFQFAAYRSRAFPRIELCRLMEAFSLSQDLLERQPSKLSGGQRQRFSIIRVLLLEPDLIVADEPTSALDEESREAVIKEILDRECTVVSTSHDHVWLNACDRVITLSHGQIVEEGYDVRFG